MPQVLAVPWFHDSFERLCDAVLTLQRRTADEPALEPVRSIPALAGATDGRAPDDAVAVLCAPGLHEAVASQTGFLCDVERIRGAAPDLPLLVCLGPRPLQDAPGISRIDDAVRVLGRLGVNEVLVQPEEATSLAVATGLQKMVLDPFALGFLRALAPELPPVLWFLICRMLQDFEDGGASTDRVLAESCGWDPEDLRTAIERSGAGSLDVWRERVALYGVVRRGPLDRGRKYLSGRDARPREELEGSCRRLTGVGLDVFAVPDGWRRLLRVLAERMKENAADPTANEPADGAAAPVSESRGTSRGFAQLVRRYRPVAFEAAYRVLQCQDRAQDAVQEIFVRVWRMGDEKWPRLSKHYFVRAARNRALNESAVRRRRVGDQGLNDLELSSTEPEALLRLEAEEAVRMRTARYYPLPPRQAVAAWLFQERAWRPREIQRLLKITPSSFRNLRWRAREVLRAPPPCGV